MKITLSSTALSSKFSAFAQIINGANNKERVMLDLYAGSGNLEEAVSVAATNFDYNQVIAYYKTRILERRQQQEH